MKKIFVVISVAILLLASSPALAGKKTADCNGPACKAWKSGIGARPGPPTKCLIEVIAPTFGGKVALDVRDASGNSRWKAPRIYHNVKPGIFKKKIGCGWGSASTDQVYLCVEGADGKRFTSIRWRAKGDLDDWLKTKRLEMCLKGRECPGYVPGDPPE